MVSNLSNQISILSGQRKLNIPILKYYTMRRIMLFSSFIYNHSNSFVLQTPDQCFQNIYSQVATLFKLTAAGYI